MDISLSFGAPTCLGPYADNTINPTWLSLADSTSETVLASHGAIYLPMDSSPPASDNDQEMIDTFVYDQELEGEYPFCDRVPEASDTSVASSQSKPGSVDFVKEEPVIERLIPSVRDGETCTSSSSIVWPDTACDKDETSTSVISHHIPELHEQVRTTGEQLHELCEQHKRLCDTLNRCHAKTEHLDGCDVGLAAMTDGSPSSAPAVENWLTMVEYSTILRNVSTILTPGQTGRKTRTAPWYLGDTTS
ncbi:hypothetical protein VNI00_015502 [Paramarasmius palmivorus]|uniref:Uncharacterized protein n=1 Tax=Paramarasmius palmivorus TaxID=297713 RepID=A0AAW0BLJ3_9AGAR